MNIIQLRNEITTLKPGILKRFNNKCYVCGFSCTSILVIHHIQHLSNSGDNQLDNLVLLCPNCHAMTHEIIREINHQPDIDILNLPNDLKIISDWITQNLGNEAEQKLISIARQERLML